MISAIVLAAGESRRMGSPKALLRYAGQTFIARICESLLSAGVDEVVTVLGARAEEVRLSVSSHPALRLVVNPDYVKGQLSSLITGLLALSPGSEAAIVALVDHPLVRVETFASLLRSFREHWCPIIIARYQDKRGHPVLFAREVYPELLAAPLDQGAKVVVRKDPARVREIQLDDPGILADIDTPEDYAQFVGRTR